MRCLLIVGGGIAAYKSLEFVRRARDAGISVRVVMTGAAQQFVTPLSFEALTGDRVFTDLFDRADEHDIGHIRLAREPDVILVAPATADLLAKMANGLANDLASTLLLATDKPVIVAPAMNPLMWAHPATCRNIETLRGDGVIVVGPATGEMAERGEAGVGRMVEPQDLVAEVDRVAGARHASMHSSLGQPLGGRRVLVTAGATHEPIDPVRYIANRSSGKQGYAIAEAARDLGASVTLVSGPTRLSAPRGVTTITVETAEQMLAAVEQALPADIAIFAAAVADWRIAREAEQKLKKTAGGAPPTLELVENPDILATVARRLHDRPHLVIGFAAETEAVIENAAAKLARKGCDWIVANDVGTTSGIAGGVMGGDRNRVHILTKATIETWEEADKSTVARRLVEKVATAMGSGARPC
ncbi:MAG: bifunctional phosphopantothenoylcysteine decarboxylase/phosphopantothenate--cysteine ligase CoaBC [Hyphomicrobiaceae bacterium]